MIAKSNEVHQTTATCFEINQDMLRRIRSHYEAEELVRRGVCLLNVGQFETARNYFQRALAWGGSNQTLATYLAGAWIGLKKHAHAAEQLGQAVEQAKQPSHTLLIREALALLAAGKSELAINKLRHGLQLEPECAELHFQLGTLLASLEQYEEAELRFTQAANIDCFHTEALVNLACVCGVRHAPKMALEHLQQAQQRKPSDARIGLLLAQASLAVKQQGYTPRVRADMPDDEALEDPTGIAELTRIIEAEPEFVEAFLAIPTGEVDERVFILIEKSISSAVTHRTDNAELLCQFGSLLNRLGRDEDAIGANERAITIDPNCTKALIELGKLYQNTNRQQDATARFEQAVQAGAEYPDVFLFLGYLYRDQGLVTKARSAYRHALYLNNHYEAAQEALAALPVA